MKFNKNWTKQDNDLHRKLLKEGKSYDERVKLMGISKLKHHPKGKYLVSDWVKFVVMK